MVILYMVPKHDSATQTPAARHPLSVINLDKFAYQNNSETLKIGFSSYVHWRVNFFRMLVADQ